MQDVQTTSSKNVQVPNARLGVQDPITWKQAYVMFIALGTVGLWCANSALDQYLGQMGIVAIIPMVFFFGFGLLNKASSPLHLLGPCLHSGGCNLCVTTYPVCILR